MQHNPFLNLSRRGFFFLSSTDLLFVFVLCVFPSGWLVDTTNDFSYAFYLSGSCLLTSAAFVILVDHLVQKRAAQPGGHQASSQAA